MVDEDHKRLREIWRSMKKRCENPKCKDFKHYGAHGIVVCKEWSEDFYAFKEWALANGYNKNMTLDRVNNNVGYKPGNVRWINKRAQAYNRKTNKFYTINGETKTLTQWCEQFNITSDVVVHRLQDGWSIDEAITTPKRAYGKRDEQDDKEQ